MSIRPPDLPERERNRVRHYYGDYARGLLIAAAIGIFAAAPRIGTLTSGATAFLVAAAVVLVVCAGLTSPRSRATLIADALVAAIEAAIFATAAVDAYQMNETYLCIVETAVAAALLLALYFSVKSVRSMTMHMLGQRPREGEFDQRA
jgi:dolichyl-phosphate-mannose--protein O-mannosyl transferase